MQVVLYAVTSPETRVHKIPTVILLNGAVSAGVNRWLPWANPKLLVARRAVRIGNRKSPPHLLKIRRTTWYDVFGSAPLIMYCSMAPTFGPFA